MDDQAASGRPPSKSRFIVLTGGPGAGKTAVLELARRSVGPDVAFLPEAASIIFGGGFLRRPTLVGRKAAQRAIFHVQREHERLIEEEGEAQAVLCDRGTLDGLAYWPEEEASYWRELGTTRAAELARYHAVIHLRTPPAGGGYNNQNPLRIEDAETAQEIDRRTERAWEGHPNRIFIESSSDFLEKALRALAQMNANLPEHCKPHPTLPPP
jgi:predicted ATPase